MPTYIFSLSLCLSFSHLCTHAPIVRNFANVRVRVHHAATKRKSECIQFQFWVQRQCTICTVVQPPLAANMFSCITYIDMCIVYMHSVYKKCRADLFTRRVAHISFVLHFPWTAFSELTAARGNGSQNEWNRYANVSWNSIFKIDTRTLWPQGTWSPLRDTKSE